MADDRIDRKEELLAAARDRLTTDQDHVEDASAPSRSSGPELRYRGQVIRQGNAGTPGSGLGGGSRSNGSSGGEDARAALQSLKDLYRDGLISRAEAEKKRAEILGRL